MMGRRAREDGVISASVAVMAVAIVAVAGLAYDGGAIITATAHARDVAQAAARAGTQAVATAAVHEGRADLDPSGATAAAESFLDAAGLTGTVSVTGATVTVTVQLVQPMRLLPVPDRVVVATGSATAVSDVLEVP